MDSAEETFIFSPFNQRLAIASKNMMSINRNQLYLEHNHNISDGDDNESNFDQDTVPDEEFNNIRNNARTKNSWPSNKDLKADPRKFGLENCEINQNFTPGPNINLKLPRKSYSSHEEKKYFYNKIKIKKKTELCKNWTLYSDCFFKDTCSFAHGDRELRQSQGTTEKYKTKSCKMFRENFYCNYGNRCIYLHVINERRLFNYHYLLKKFTEEFTSELVKKENQMKELWKVLQIMRAKKQYVIQRLEVFEGICSFGSEVN